MGTVLKTIVGHKAISEDQILNAYKSLRRLQRFYMISASDMAAGRHNKRNIGDQMDGIYVTRLTREYYIFR